MPVSIKAQGKVLTKCVAAAESRLAGIVGLICRDTERQEGLLIPSCRGVHTFGMQYAIDVLFLDSEDKVIKILHSMKPRRISRQVKGAARCLELPAGRCREVGLNEGDRLEIAIDSVHDVRSWVRHELIHVAVNIGLALFYLRFVDLSYLRWQETESVIPFGLLFVNSLLVYLFLTRRRSRQVSRRAVDWFAALGTVFLSLCLNAEGTAFPLLLKASCAIQVLGILGMLASLASLGRSFGIIAALRSIKSDGMYSLVRHPLYASELVFYVGFVLGNPHTKNIVLVIGILIGQYVRAIAEERILSTEKPYRLYLTRVRYRFIPGLF